jgi:uncharacterized membrane protein YphA (DoxX/SURF4 family)
LVFGLATRFAALPMLILSLVIQFSCQALDQHLFWAILFGWFVVEGAGPISLDALIGRGIAATAPPLAGTITLIFEAMSRWGDPVIKLLLRCWIAAPFFRSGVMKISNFDMTQMLFHARSAQWLLPPELATRLIILIELACLIFLVVGGGHEDHGDLVDRAHYGRRPHLPAPDRPCVLPDAAKPHCSPRAGRGVA